MDKIEQDRYTLTLDDGTVWAYDGTDVAPWKKPRHFVSFGPHRDDPTVRVTSSELRRAADVVKRWERDHAPRVRKRVVRGWSSRWWDCQRVDGVVQYRSYTDPRCSPENQVARPVFYPDDLDALNGLAAHPYEVSRDGGATWTPCATEDGR